MYGCVGLRRSVMRFGVVGVVGVVGVGVVGVVDDCGCGLMVVCVCVCVCVCVLRARGAVGGYAPTCRVECWDG